MDPISTDRLTPALDALDPADRALLELSFRNGLPPEEVADLLGSSPAAVVDRRDEALQTLSDELGGDADYPELERAIAAAGPPPPAEDGEDASGRDPGLRAPPGRLKRRLIMLGVVAIVLGIVAGIVIASSGDGSDHTKSSGSGPEGDASPGPARPRSAPRKLGPTVGLDQQIQGVDGTVSARLVRSGGRTRLALRARGLPKPAGKYEVWLLDAPKRALSLARFDSGAFELNARLPANFSGYQQLDVTIEPSDGNPDHSGLSTFRTQLADLAIR